MATLIKYPEAAARLGIKEITLRKWVSARRVPFTKLGAAVRFNTDELDRFVEENTHRPEPVPEGAAR